MMNRTLFFLLTISLVLVSGMATALTLSGKVIDRESSIPVSGATIEIGGFDIKTAADDNGRFVVENMEPGKYKINLSSVGYFSEMITYQLTESSPELIVYLRSKSIQLEPVMVTARHNHTRFDEIREKSNSLGGGELQKELGQTLASTMKNEAGLAIRSMGPAPARPVIRGLGGDRVTISEDGNNTNDLSATSPDHAITIQPFILERIELVRGPRLLAQTSNTFGGLINVIRHDIPVDYQSQITGTFGTYGETANESYLGSFSAIVPVSKFNFKVDLLKKEGSDLRTPSGKLENSFSDNSDYGFGTAMILNRGVIGFSVREFSLDYGIPGGFVGAHPGGVLIDMFKRQYNFKADYRVNSEILENLELHLGRDYYRHREYENDDVIGSEFKIVNYHGFLNMNHNEFLVSDNGTLGISFNMRDLDFGGLIFSPPSESYNSALYLIETFIAGHVTVESGVRLSYDRIKPDRDKPDTNIGSIRSREFLNLSASVSVLYGLNDNIGLGTNLSRTTRVPSLEELFSEGPHLAAYSFEVGNPDLEAERGVGGEIYGYYKSKQIYLLTNFFYNDFSNFIIHRNTGEINWTTVLPIYSAEGTPARLYGFETELELNLAYGITLGATVSYTKGEFKDNDRPLPQIPPLKSKLELSYGFRPYSFGVAVISAGKQDRVDLFEEPTDGYTIVNLNSQALFTTGGQIHSLSISIDNLFDTEHRNHLSRVKSIMPEAGISVRIAYKLFFEI